MRALIDAIPSPVYFKDSEGRYSVRNRAWEELFGGGKDWTGKTVRDMFDADIASVHEEHDRALLDRPSSTTYEMLMPTTEGDKRQMLYNKVSFVDQRGDVAGLIGVITDVTRYKETERALEASEARFRVLTESSIDLISVIDAEGFDAATRARRFATCSGSIRPTRSARTSTTSSIATTWSRFAPHSGASPTCVRSPSRSSSAFATATAAGARSSPWGRTAFPIRTSAASCGTRATSPTAR